MLKKVIFLLAVLNEVMVSSAFDTSSCGKTKSCFVSDIGLQISFSITDSILNLELSANNLTEPKAYVAVGFSGDECMGKEPVIECSQLDVFEGVRGRYSTNPKEPIGNERIVGWSEANNQAVLQTIAASKDGDVLSCSLSVNINRTSVEAAVGRNFSDLLFFPSLTSNYYILLARGPTNGTALLSHHKGNTAISPAINFTVPVSIGVPGGNLASKCSSLVVVLISLQYALASY